MLDKHRDVASCASCHNKIDPLGFALESFDVIGLRRDRFRNRNSESERVDAVVRGRKVQYRLGPVVDSSGQFTDSSTYTDFSAYRDYLATHDDRLARALASKLLTFATGRELGFSDPRRATASSPTPPKTNIAFATSFIVSSNPNFPEQVT